MKKIIILIILAVAGVSNVMGQSGSVRRPFYMESCSSNKEVDTCTVTLYIKDGVFNGAEFLMPCSNENYLVRATMESDTPAWYNGQKRLPEQLNAFVEELLFIKQKFIEWSAVAKENKVTLYKKEIKTFEKSPVLSLSIFKDGERYFQENDYKVPYVWKSNPIFNVDAEGKCHTFFGWVNMRFERIIGYEEGLLYSTPLKKSIVVSQLSFQFNTVEQIQSLLDALNVETAIVKLDNNKDKDLDKLFQ